MNRETTGTVGKVIYPTSLTMVGDGGYVRSHFRVVLSGRCRRPLKN